MTIPLTVKNANFSKPGIKPRKFQQNRRRHLAKCTDCSLGTWNVKTLNKPGAMKSVLEQIDKYNMKITAIQETRWLGKGIMDLKKHTIRYSGKAEGNKEFGVAFCN
jgi:hypothetical protein